LPLSLTPWISRDDLGDLLGEDLTTSDSALIACDAACDVVRTEAEQTFNVVNYDEIILDGSGTDALLLPERPVNGVDSVEVNGTAVDNWVLNSLGVLIRTESPTIEDWGDWPYLFRLTWPSGRQNITVTYDHGYADDDFPRDVRVVALQCAARIYSQATSVAAAGVESETLGSYSISYATNSSSSSANGDGDLLTSGERAILRKYRMSKSF
jgi:hypothetical protein